MLVINSKNVNDAYATALYLIKMHGVESDSRNGKVLKFPGPVTTMYGLPFQRVLFDEKRDANPYLHLFESLWMLNGDNDVAFPAQFSKSFLEFSDDGKTLHGAYGHRWRKHFGHDQLDMAIFELYTNPTSRRVVIGMWDPYLDDSIAYGGGKDVPCNTQIMFNVRPGGALDMTVTNRSNDAVWGCYGANAVHMSILHEYVALSAGLPLGVYYQVSNDLHVYEQHFNLIGVPPQERYPYPIVTQALFRNPGEKSDFDKDVKDFVADPDGQILYRTKYMRDTVGPMFRSWKLHKMGLKASALDVASQIEDEAWRIACTKWLQRRADKSPLILVK